MDALLNTIETLVMLGDPDLNPDNQNEWISLISKCLPCKTLPKHLNCAEDARCLQHVAGCFEDFTLHSTLFQVSCAAEPQRKHFPKFRAEDPRCICSATMTVRMWTTANEDVTISPGEGNKKNCAFHTKSTLYKRLLSIPTLAAQSSVSSTSAPLTVIEVKPTCSPVDGSVIDLIPIESDPAPVTTLDMASVPSTAATPVPSVGLATGCYGKSVNVFADETSPTGHKDRHPDQKIQPPDSFIGKLHDEPENLYNYDTRTQSLESISSQKAKHEDLFSNIAPCDSRKKSNILGPPYISRRAPFLSMRLPSRDAKFFGRDGYLIPLERILTPGFVPSSGQSTGRDSDTVIVLSGIPGVGKSAIALELVYRIRATFDFVFWLRANSDLHLAQSFHQAAVSLGLVPDRGDHNHESSRQKFIAWLSTTTARWLLVLDDADELQTLLNIMPNRCGGFIIVTSRQKVGAGPDVVEDECLYSFQIGPFVIEDATKFIRSLAPCAFRAENTSTDLATLATIAKDCGCLPLTLRRVGTIINNYHDSSRNKRVMSVLEQHPSSVLASRPSSSLISNKLSSTSFALFNVITFLDTYCVSDAVLLGAQRYKSVPLTAFPMEDHDYMDAKNELIAHALLAVGSDSGALNVHRVTARSLRTNLDPDSFRKGFQSACRLLEARWPSRRKMKNIVLGNWPEFDDLHRHVHTLSSILVEYNRLKNTLNSKQEISDDSYLRVLFLSTW